MSRTCEKHSKKDVEPLRMINGVKHNRTVESIDANQIINYGDEYTWRFKQDNVLGINN